MVKVRSPLLGFSARGSLGGEISYYERGGETYAKRSPEHVDARTYLQQRQRWMFQDAGQYWHSLSGAEQEAYWVAGVPLRLTAYQACLRAWLTTMPDTGARWHFDRLVGGVVRDWGAHGNDLTVFGAALVVSDYGNALWFDGVDDYAEAANDASLEIENDFTIVLRFRLLVAWGAQDRNASIFEKKNEDYVFQKSWDSDFPRFRVTDSGNVVHSVSLNIGWVAGQSYVMVFRRAGNITRVYRDNKDVGGMVWAGSIRKGGNVFYVGRQAPGRNARAEVDFLWIVNRGLSLDHIAKINARMGVAV